MSELVSIGCCAIRVSLSRIEIDIPEDYWRRPGTRSHWEADIDTAQTIASDHLKRMVRNRLKIAAPVENLRKPEKSVATHTRKRRT